jgi:hypothetical protein
LQQVLDTYRNRGLNVLAINLEPAQHNQVLPLLKATGISFVPLESDWAWAQKEYGVEGTPEAMLLDERGRIMFRPEVHDAETRALLERQIDTLLSRPR